MKIKKYEKYGKIHYKVHGLYLGIDPFTGKEIRKTKSGFKSKREAEIYVAKIKTELAEKGVLSNENTKFKEVFELFLVGYKDTVKESTLLSNTYAFNLILDKIGRMDIKKINVTHCQKIINDYSEKYSISILKRIKTYGTMIFEHAVRMRLIYDNPMSHVLIPRRPVNLDEDESILYYTMDELRCFLELVQEHRTLKQLTMFRLLAFTGMRKGEMQSLTWEDIDFINNTININKTVALNMNKKLTVQSPKSKSSVRKISIDEGTSTLLKKWKLTQKEELFKRGMKPKEKQLCFSDSKNKLLDLMWLNRKMKQICKKYNFKEIKIHGFRHTHCSLMFESGATIQEVQNRLGHSDLKTTMGIYAHVTQKQKDNLAIKFSKYVNF